MNLSATGTLPTRLLKGRIHNMRKTRRNQDFCFTATDRAKMGATAIAAGLAGLGGIATGLSGMAMDTTEEADLLEFDLDGCPVRAWVWQSIFNEGDDVEVVAEQVGKVWQGYGIFRPNDQIVALHPHCSRGRYAHYRASFLLYVKFVLPLLLVFLMLFFAGGYFMYGADFDWAGAASGIFIGCVLGSLIYGTIAFRISKKFKGFVRLAEGIFEAFGWRDVKNIDLPAITKKGKKAGDPAALGVLYFSFPDGRREVRKSPEIDRTSSE
ncbi:putative type VI secretion system effector [Burkholderia territorii]|uniref:putative type VI secretion system effector n=1 Tax=Burkholderia territorii TaxID=1503055 RepID=UPI0009C121BB|nr:putative type VI secretion system effector [Burkholderia territorii]